MNIAQIQEEPQVEEEPPVEEEHKEMSSIDRLTLELMMNKSQYKKYLAKNEPAIYHEKQTYNNHVANHKSQIMEIFKNLIDEQCSEHIIIGARYNNKVETAYTAFVKEVVEMIGVQDSMNLDQDQENELFPIESTTHIYENRTIHKSSIYTMDKYVDRK